MSHLTPSGSVPHDGGLWSGVRELDSPYRHDTAQFSVATPSCCCCCSCCLTAAVLVPMKAGLDSGDRALAHERSSVPVTLVMIAVMAAGLGLIWYVFFDAYLDTDIWRWPDLALATFGLTAAMSAVRWWAGEPPPRAIGWSAAVVAAWSGLLFFNFLVDLVAIPLLPIEWLLIPVWCAFLIRGSYNRRKEMRYTRRVADAPPDHIDPYNRFRNSGPNRSPTPNHSAHGPSDGAGDPGAGDPGACDEGT